MLSRFLLAAALTVLLAAACATSAPTSRKATTSRASDGTPYDFKREGAIPAPTENDTRSEVDVEEMPVANEGIDVSDAPEPPPVTTPAAVAHDSLVDGFRIQVFASSDREVAENARLVAEQRLRLPGYLELEDGVYKVRVGNFATRPPADDALGSVRRDYADAWIVPAKVLAGRSG